MEIEQEVNLNTASTDVKRIVSLWDGLQDLRCTGFHFREQETRIHILCA
jgi:hypothetical protein